MRTTGMSIALALLVTSPSMAQGSQDTSSGEEAKEEECLSEDSRRGRLLIPRGLAVSCEQLAEQKKLQADRERKSKLPPRAITQAEKKRVMAYYNMRLKDAPSARWKWGKVVYGSIACVLINAKNSFGGYTGWSPYKFDLQLGSEVTGYEHIAPEDLMNREIQDICERAF